MFNIKWVIVFAFFQIVKPSQLSSESKDIFYRSHDRILEIIDNVLISLKIDEKFKKSKNVAEYFSMHNYIQDAVEKNEQVYQNIRRTFKTNLSNKTSILNVNEVIDKTIRKQQSIIFKELIKNNSKIRAIANNNILKDFTELARDFHLKLDIPVANDIKSLADFKNVYPISRNIFHEATSTIKKFPFMVSIHVRDFFACSGSLLREDLVISAASRLVQFVSEDSDVTPLNVRVSSDYINKKGELIPIADLIFHSDFNPSNLNHNLVIIRLKKQIKLEKKALLKYDRVADDLPNHVEGIFYLGWGEKDINQHDYNYDKEDQKLSYARLHVYDFMDCLNHFRRFYISEQQFCAGIFKESNGVCKNDVGGPAIVGDTLVGVISFSSPHCGHPGVPTVFTKIGFYAEWITRVFEAFPLPTLPEPKTDVSTHEDESQDKSDETIMIQKEEPNMRPRIDPELNSSLKQKRRNDSFPNDVHNDTLEHTTKQDAPHPPEVTTFKTTLVPILRMFTENQTNPTQSPVVKLSESQSAADTTDKLDWMFVNNIFDKLLTSETSSLSTPTEKKTPVITSSSLSIDRFTPFTQNTENFNYFDENNEDDKQSKEYENDMLINAKGDLSYENEDDSKVEVVIKEFGTTKLFVLDRKMANARKSLAIIKEKLSKHYPGGAIDWLTMISTT